VQAGGLFAPFEHEVTGQEAFEGGVAEHEPLQSVVPLAVIPQEFLPEVQDFPSLAEQPLIVQAWDA
jgi:hypothetical protein